MGMDYAIAILSFCGVLSAAILKFAPNRKNNKYVTKDLCDERVSNIKESIDRIDNNIRRIFELLDNIGKK